MVKKKGKLYGEVMRTIFFMKLNRFSLGFNPLINKTPSYLRNYKN